MLNELEEELGRHEDHCGYCSCCEACGEMCGEGSDLREALHQAEQIT